VMSFGERLYGSGYRDMPPRGRPLMIGRGLNGSLWDEYGRLL